MQKGMLRGRSPRSIQYRLKSARGRRASGALTGGLAEVLFEFVLFVAPFVGIGRRFALAGDIRPDIRELAVNLKILVGAIIRVHKRRNRCIRQGGSPAYCRLRRSSPPGILRHNP
jgi:hypothetical protein